MKEKSVDTKKEEIPKGKHTEYNQSSPLKCSKCDHVFEKKSFVDSHMFKQREKKKKILQILQVYVCKQKYKFSKEAYKY